MLSDSSGVVVQAGQSENKVPMAAPEGAGLHQGPAALDTVPLVKQEATPSAATVAIPAQVSVIAASPAVAEASPTVESDGPTSDEVPPEEENYVEEAPHLPRLSGWGGRAKGRRLVKPPEMNTRGSTTPEQKLLILDTWMRSGLPVSDFASIVGISKHTLYIWKKRFDEQGPAGLLDRGHGGKKGSRLPEITKRTILMLKKANPTWGCQRISDMLVRGPALPASPEAVARVLHEDGYETIVEPTRPHPDKVRSFERAKPNQLWQTDLFTFTLKRQNRRVNLIAFLDDHSRFIVSYGLYGSSSTALVLEVLNAAIASYGPPEEILTDNGPQYAVWRGKSAFTKELEKRGIKQIVAHPRRPRTLGKVERFWGTLWRECVESSIFLDLEDARKRIGLFIDYYNFQRPHQGLDGLVPADRFFGAENQVRQALESTMARNEVLLALEEAPRKPVYLVGQIGDQQVSMHGEKGRMVIQTPDGRVQEMDFGNLGMGTKGVGDGRGAESQGETGISGSGEAEVQDTDQGGSSSEGPVGNSYTPGAGTGAPDGGDDAGILDGSGEERRSGGEVGSAPSAGLADVATGPVGDGSGLGETTEEREKEPTIDIATRGGSEGFEQENPGIGERPGFDERAGEVVEGTPGEPGGDEKG